MSEKFSEDEAFAVQLAKLKPAIVSIDSRDVFFQAGFAAGRASLQASQRKQLAFAVAASVLLTVVSAATVQRIGSVYRGNQVALLQNKSLDTVPVDKQSSARNSLEPKIDATELQGSAGSEQSRAAKNFAEPVQRSPLPASPWWMQLAQSFQPQTTRIVPNDSMPLVYRVGLSADDWSKFAEIPRPVAPAVESIEYSPVPDDDPLLPLDSMRLRPSSLIPWL